MMLSGNDSINISTNNGYLNANINTIHLIMPLIELTFERIACEISQPDLSCLNTTKQMRNDDPVLKAQHFNRSVVQLDCQRLAQPIIETQIV